MGAISPLTSTGSDGDAPASVSAATAADQGAGASQAAASPGPGVAGGGAPAPPGARPHAGRRSWRRRPDTERAALLLSTVAILSVIGGGWWVAHRSGQVEREVARRLQTAERELADRGTQLRDAGDALREAKGRLSVLEDKLSDSVAQQAQLERLYQELARTRNDAVLAEVEATLVSAAQQLQLGSSVRGSLLALQEADARLDRIRLPAASPLRRAISADIERLRAAETVDVAALATRLDGLAETVDSLPLLSEPRAPSAEATTRPPARSLPARARADGAATTPDTAEPPGESWGARLARWNVVLQELGQWIRVRRADRPDALLVAPDQAWFVRENLKLRLSQARWSLLTRNEAALRADVARATEALERWFDRDQRGVAQALSTLSQVGGAARELAMPSIGESLTAVRLARSSREPD